MERHSILIVEDDKEILDGISIFLRNQGYDTVKAHNGKEGLQALEEHTVHLAIVDIMMPVMDGITMTMRLREKYDIPVIFLSAKSEEIDKVTGLNIGADDYVTKPFSPMELLARVNSQLRRYARYMRVQEAPAEQAHVYREGGLELDEDTVQVTVDGEPVKLTPLEFKILALLIKHPGRVFPADEIYERVWNEKAVGTETIMVHIRNLREKIEVNPRDPQYIKVVWGIGYKLEKQKR